jgi:hypothetical protein
MSRLVRALVVLALIAAPRCSRPPPRPRASAIPARSISATGSATCSRPRSSCARSGRRRPTPAGARRACLSELEAIDQRLTDKRKQVAALDGRMRRAQGDITELQGEIARLQRAVPVRRRSSAGGCARSTSSRPRAGFCHRALRRRPGDPGGPAAPPDHPGHGGRPSHSRVSCDLEVLADRKSRVETRGKELAVAQSEAEQERAEFDQEAAKRAPSCRRSRTSGRTTTGWSGSCPRPPAGSRRSSGICREAAARAGEGAAPEPARAAGPG